MAAQASSPTPRGTRRGADAETDCWMGATPTRALRWAARSWRVAPATPERPGEEAPRSVFLWVGPSGMGPAQP
eukprot:8650412-Pyramimonas_sp.AAC.1